MPQVLVVDGANVVGSVPDGWWRDRAGAAARLHAQLGGLAERYDEVILVLEGQARAGVPAGVDGGVRTVHAGGSGDDEIAARCRGLVAAGAQVAVATADRGLIARMPPTVTVVGPRSVRTSRPG